MRFQWTPRCRRDGCLHSVVYCCPQCKRGYCCIDCQLVTDLCTFGDGKCAASGFRLLRRRTKNGSDRVWRMRKTPGMLQRELAAFPSFFDGAWGILYAFDNLIGTRVQIIACLLVDGHVQGLPRTFPRKKLRALVGVHDYVWEAIASLECLSISRIFVWFPEILQHIIYHYQIPVPVQCELKTGDEDFKKDDQVSSQPIESTTASLVSVDPIDPSVVSQRHQESTLV